MGLKVLLSFKLLLLFLAFSFLLSPSSAVPTTRILKSTAQDLVFQDVRDLEINDVDSLERLFEGRLILENNDYPGTGANNHHDPKSPARP